MARIEKIEITHEEHVALIRELPLGTPVHTSFGPNHVDLVVDLDKPETHAPAKLLLAMRGITNQNCDGAGI